jgi:hypothetical protein
MNPVVLPDDPAGAFRRFHLSDFEVSWAGPNPVGEGFCLGSEDGRIRFTDTQLTYQGEIKGVSASGEAVNGVAHSQQWTAVTTRADVNLISRPKAEGLHEAIAIPVGAFGVTVASSGHFVVPLGRGGIMYVKPGSGPEDPVPVGGTEKAGLNVCRVLPLPGQDGTDLIVCAGRAGGVGMTTFREGVGNYSLSTLRVDGLDVVDVCLLGARENRFAVSAVGRDGTLIIFRDILYDRSPRTIKFRSVRGTVYRILSSQGHVFLLTSKGLFVLARLAERLAGDILLEKFNTDVLPLQVAAADANLVGERWLVAVGVGEVLRFDLQKMPPPDTQTQEDRNGLVHLTTAPWMESRIEQSMQHLAATG